MKVGASTRIYWDFEKVDHEYAVSHLKDMGFESVEILCDHPFFPDWPMEGIEKTAKRIKEIVESHDMGLTIHAPFYDLNIASWNKGVMRETTKQFIMCIKMANSMNAEIVVVHPGYIPSNKFNKEKTIELMTLNFKDLAKTAKDYGVYMCVENMAQNPFNTCVTLPETRGVLRGVDNEHFRLTLDVAHINTTGNKPEHYFRKLKEDVFHVHMSDNKGENIHLPIGLGYIDFEAFFRALGNYKRVVNIEGWMPHNQDVFLKWDKEKIDEILKKIRA